MSQIVEEYNKFGKITTISFTREKSIPFPEVTVCSGNAFSKVRFSNWLKNCQPKGTDITNMICDHSQKIFGKITSGDSKIESKKRMLIGSLNLEIVVRNLQFIKDLSLSLDDMTSDLWKYYIDREDRLFNVSDSLWKFNGYLPNENAPLLTPGSCYSFHWNSQFNLEASKHSLLHVPLKNKWKLQDCFDGKID